MYLTDFFKKLFKLKNFGVIIWIILNLWIMISFFYTMTNSNTPLSIALGIVSYIGSVALALSPIGENIFRSMHGCELITDPAILNRLSRLFNEVYSKAKIKDQNLSNNIKLYIVNDIYPNAFALGRNTVCVTRGLLNMSNDEIRGVFAHEFSHLSNKDTDFLLFVCVGNLIVSAMFLIFRIILFALSFLLPALGSSKNKTFKGFIFAILLDKLYMLVVGLWIKFGLFLVNHSNRNHEYEADKFAYDLGYGIPLRNALEILRDENGNPSGFVANLMSTHPDINTRIDKLNSYIF